jgi:SNF2 family DNA or RNA helicase
MLPSGSQIRQTSSFLLLQKDDRLKELTFETRKWLVHRKKKLIAHQLPKKIDQVVFCELSAVQLRAYK